VTRMERRRAEKKLREARFFLGRLREEEGQAVRPEPEAFDFYASGFLAAAVSVIYALRYENRGSFDHWFSKWKKALPPEDAQLLGRGWGERDAEVHETGADIVREQRAMRPELVKGFHIVAPLHPGTTLATGTWVSVDEHYFDTGEERVEAVDLFRQFLGLLDRLLSELPKS